MTTKNPNTPEGEPERALLIQAIGRGESRFHAERLADELGHLVRSAGLVVAGLRLLSVTHIHPATYLGRGQIANTKEEIQELEADVVVVNHAITPVQQRNLEKDLDVKVIDRTGLILEIFASRARTREGQLQVHLAFLLYQQSRLVRTWTHLERQRGGVGLRGGPGETQIEVDRRLIRDKIQRIKRELTQVQRTRSLHRRARQDAAFFTVALVGYTNAGKSTLFNRLTEAGVYVADQLFATLDPTMRGMTLPNGDKIILSDTVGFIRDLPHQLVAAFRATLEEVLEADLLLHVVDLSDPEWEAQKKAVKEVLVELGAENRPMLTLYNKIDCIPEEEYAIVGRVGSRPDSLTLSATAGTGLGKLLNILEDAASKAVKHFRLDLPAVEGALFARLCREGRILDRRDEDDRLLVTIALSPSAAGRLHRELEMFKIPDEWVRSGEAPSLSGESI